MPDASTAAAALQSGEIDWWERPTIDLLPRLARLRGVKVELLLKDGAMAVLRLNQTQAPFDNPKVRRALLPAIDQSAYMMAARGEDRSGWEDGVGFFLPGTPMASARGMEALTGPRSIEAARQALRESGYANEPTVMLLPSDFFDLNAFGEVAVDMMQRIGLNVVRQDMDWGALIQRLLSPRTNQGGWSAFCTTLPGAYTLDPAVNWYLRGNGRAGGVGWPTSARIEELRSAWIAATEQTRRVEIAAELQAQAFEDLPHVPLGRFFQPTAYRTTLSNLSNGFPTFYNVRKS
jgi:peptide/nickel transport system substrate-binding protein